MPAIVSADVFDIVQLIMDKRKAHRIGNNTAKNDYLLTGKIVCGECGGSYTGSSRKSGRNKKLYVEYQCSRRKRNYKSCDNKEIRREYVESFVISEIARIVFDDESLDELVAEYGLEIGQIQVVRNLYSEENTLLRDVIEMLKSGKFLQPK